MRYVKFFALVLVFVLSMFFFVQNNGPLSTAVQLELNLVVVRFYSLPLPLYVMVLLGFFLGAVFCLAFFLFERVRLGLEMKGLRTRVSSLEDELLAVRTQPLEQPSSDSSQPGSPA
jgi:lipopolysaccharide assembly protein A